LLISVYNTLNLITAVFNQRGTVLLIGPSKEIQKFYFFFKFSQNSNVFYLNKWLPGLLTNWNVYVNFLDKLTSSSDFNFYKSNNKINFFRFLFALKKKEKPSLILFVDSTVNNIIVEECYSENVPLVVIRSVFSAKDYNKIPYKIITNPHNIYNQWIYCQLFFGQFFINNKC
jgi:ribosomal protein S2